MTVSIIERGPMPVSLSDVKQHLRVDHSDDDGLIAGYLDAAIEHVSALYNRAIGINTYLWTLDEGICGTILALPFPPLRSIVAVRYLNDVGLPTDYETTLFEAFRRHGSTQSYLRFTAPAAVSTVANVEFIAGDDFVPYAIQAAIKMMAARLYEHRGELVDGKLVEDRAAASLLSPYRPMVV